MSGMAKNRLKSSWTPLSSHETNNKLFEERKDLINKWFEKWSDVQRKLMLEEVVLKCKPKQLEFLEERINAIKPISKGDFTRVLPRALSLYIFSFMDPRSLCRSSQVCWHWKSISELDQIWMPKCIKLGWLLPFKPSPFEVGVWKRHYIENIIILKCLTPSLIMPTSSRTPRTPKSQRDNSHQGNERRSSSASRPPWKGSDPVPKDIWRNNYLDNSDEVDNIKKLRERTNYYSQEVQELTKSVTKKVHSGKRIHIPRSKSVTVEDINKFTGERPSWAASTLNGIDNLQLSSGRPPPPPNAFVRPKSVLKISQRTNRDPPSEPLFTDRPWNLVNDEDEY